jgi:hypothetical protein
VRTSRGDRDHSIELIARLRVHRGIALSEEDRRLPSLADPHGHRDHPRHVRVERDVGQPADIPPRRALTLEHRADGEPGGREHDCCTGDRGGRVRPARHQAPARDGLAVKRAGEPGLEAGARRMPPRGHR